MGNPLTGEFDVVALFGLGAVNRILAAQHQESGQNQIYLHSIRSIIREDVLDGVKGVAEIQISPPTISLPGNSDKPVVATAVAASAPAGALPMKLTEDAEPTVGLAPDTEFNIRGEGSRVIVHFQIRVRFRPDPGSKSAPEFIHGELQLTVSPDQIISPSANAVSISLAAEDVLVSFKPDPGTVLSSAERTLVTKAASHLIENAIGTANLIVDLPQVTDGFGLSHWRFKTLPHASRAAMALLLNMRPDHVPTQAHRESYDNNFLNDGDDFAFAIGSDFLVPTLRDLLEEQIKQEVDGKSYSVKLRWLPDPTYEIELVDKPEVMLEQGAIEINISLTATTKDWTPDVNLTLKQRIGLSPANGTLILELIDDLSISFSFSGGILGWIANRIKFLFENTVKNTVSAALAQAFNDAQSFLEETLSEAKVLTEKLRIPPPKLTYKTVDISTAGITIHGDLTIDDWKPVVVAFDSRRLLPNPQQPKSQLEFSALRSWIPGGTIRRFRWLLSSGVSTGAEIVHEHRFTMQPSQQILNSFLWGSWCLEVSGMRDGKVVTASNCGLIGPPVVAWPGDGVGEEDEDPLLPISILDATGNLVAHVNLANSGIDRHPANVTPANILVHFAGTETEATPVLMRELLPRLELEEKNLLVISVIKPGTLATAQVNKPLDVPNAQLVWAEDFEGSWARTFKVREGRPAFLVIPPDGIVWRSSREPSVVELAELRHYIKDFGIPPLRVLRTAVREHEQAPNFLFDFIPGTKMKLKTFHGQQVHINFFKTWSEPCLDELRNLHTLQERQGEQGGVILTIADGEDGQQARSLFEKYGYQFRLVADPNRQIARQYGIVSWPTTITVDAGGFIQEIRSSANPVPHLSEDDQIYQVK